MTLKITTSTHADSARIHLEGRFDFNSQRQFRAAYDAPLNDGAVRTLEIDLGSVEYLDSSALGMLLLLKERAGNAKKELALVNCHGAVLQVLEVANFHKLFTMR
jgi:anti-anti-sigma factor